MTRRTFFPILLALALVAASAARAGDEPSLPPRALYQAIEAGTAPLILDVRTPEEYARGHVPGALLIPHDQLAERLDELGGAREVVVYCHSGRRAGMAEDILVEAGIGVRQLDGSWLGWQAAGLPAATGPEREDR